MNGIDRQPVGQDVTFPESAMVARQCMILMFGVKSFAGQQYLQHTLQKGQV